LPTIESEYNRLWQFANVLTQAGLPVDKWYPSADSEKASRLPDRVTQRVPGRCKRANESCDRVVCTRYENRRQRRRQIRARVSYVAGGRYRQSQREAGKGEKATARATVTPKPSSKAAKATAPKVSSANPGPAEHSHQQHAPSGSASSPEPHIDVQIHISPESNAEQIDKIFKSMAKHLKDFRT